MARIGDDHEPAAAERSAPLGLRVGSLDAGPRFEERDGGGAGGFPDGDEEALARSRLDDHPLVHDDVFLEPALEVVAERGVGTRGGQVPVVGLHEASFTDAMAPHVGADRHDAAHHLMTGDRGQLARDVARDLRQDGRVETGQDLALARMRREGMEQLGIREADADSLDPGEDLVRTGRSDRLCPIVDEPRGSHELDGVLRGGQGRGGGGWFIHLSAPRGGVAATRRRGS